MKNLSIALGLSLLFHLLFLAGAFLLKLPFEHSGNLSQKETLEISIENSTPEKKQVKTPQQIVRQALAPEKLKTSEDETLARLLSEQRQRVKQETKAALNGMTANRGGGPQPPEQQNQKQEIKQAERQQNRQEKTSLDGYRTVDITKELQELNQLKTGVSTIGENLPTNVKVGSFTALNTDRYLFYTFYARIEELIRLRWESRVQRAINNLDRSTVMTAGNKNWNTQIEFLLDRQGFLQRALLMKESGINSFDAAAIEAFKEARVFPNPPAEMVQEDGYIHLKFNFTVNYRTPTLVNRN